ncbi:MAG TPA: hypothetical protein VKR22_00440, partial [Acidimicrobiales bacterium]|nr:hypothetical protein [Acidimicrobiales bacterium]
LLTGAFAVLGTVLAHRLGGLRAGRWTAALLIGEMAAIGPATIAMVWNPVIIIVPTSVFIIALAGVASGRWWMLAWAAIVGSFLVQTHVSTGLVVPVVAVVAVIVGLTRRDTRAMWPRALVPPMATALALGTLVWLPPLIEQVGASHGNLGRVVDFFRAHPHGYGLGAATQAVSHALWPPLTGQLSAGAATSATTASIAVIVGVGLLALALVGAGLLARRRSASILGVLSLVVLVVGLVSATRATGGLYGYLTEWLVGLEVPLLLGWVVLVPRRALHLAGFAAAAAASVALVSATFVEAPPLDTGRPVTALFRQLRPALPAPTRGPVLLDVASADTYPELTGLVVELTHAGYHVEVQDDWRFLFGGSFGHAGHPSTTATLWDTASVPSDLEPAAASVPGFQVVLNERGSSPSPGP